MSRIEKAIACILKGRSDANFAFEDLCLILKNDEFIIYWSKADESFIVEVPELPGCMADGANYEEAVANAKEVVQDWIDTAQSLGRQIPEPKGRLAYA